MNELQTSCLPGLGNLHRIVELTIQLIRWQAVKAANYSAARLSSQLNRELIEGGVMFQFRRSETNNGTGRTRHHAGADRLSGRVFENVMRRLGEVAVRSNG